MSKDEFVKGLRELADFLEQRDTDLRLKRKTWDFMSYNSHEEHITKMVKLLGHCEKFETRDTIGIRRRFGPIVIQFRWLRNAMCKKVKVKEYTLPGKWEYQYVNKPVTQAEYKWVCPKSFLSACCEEDNAG